MAKKDKKDKKHDKKKPQKPEPVEFDSSEEEEEDSDNGNVGQPPNQFNDSDEEESEEEVQTNKKRRQENDSPAPKKTKRTELTLFIGNLPFTTTESEVKKFFSKCGVADIRLVTDSNSGKSKGYGYVDFSTEEDLDKALNLNGSELGGRSVKIDRTKSSVGTEHSKVVFVGNLSWDSDEDSLRNLFSDCGEINSVRIITDRDTGNSKGFGYVEFADESGADEAVKLHGTELDGRNLRINYEGGDRGGDRGGRGGDRGGRGGRGGDRGGRGGRGGFDRGDRRGGDRRGGFDRGGRGGRGGFDRGDRGGRGGRGGFDRDRRGGDRGGRGGGRGRGSEFQGKRITFD